MRDPIHETPDARSVVFACLLGIVVMLTVALLAHSIGDAQTSGRSTAVGDRPSSRTERAAGRLDTAPVDESLGSGSAAFESAGATFLVSASFPEGEPKRAGVSSAQSGGNAAAVPRPAPNGRAALIVAQACYVEAAFSRRDCAAMVGVARRRAARVDRPWLEVLVEYSALDAATTRAAAARLYPDGDVAGMGKRWNGRWAALRAHARRIVDGEQRSPCPAATHWGSRTIENDVRRAIRAIDAGRWRAVPCGDTANAFYAEVRR